MVATKDKRDEIPSAHGDAEDEAAKEAARIAAAQPVLDLSAWDIELAKIATPFLLADALKAAKITFAELPTSGRSVEIGGVVDRNIGKSVAAQALKFSQEVNATTSKKLSDALEQLRGELLEGITGGDTRTQMRNRVMDVFEELDRDRATVIAHTESSRARHDAQLTTVKESGVSKGKSFLISEDCCDLCRDYAEQGVIPLDQPFAVTAYGPVMHAPAHPLCACSTFYALKSPAEIDAAGIANAGKAVMHDPRTGEFASAGGLGGAAEDAEKTATKSGRTKEPKPSPKTKAMIAKQSATYVGKDIQRYAEEHNEPQFAKSIGGLSYADNEPVDVVSGSGGVVEHGCELKTMVSNKASKLTMDRYAQVRKVAWESDNKATFHTCVIDDRDVFNAKGPGLHDETKRTYYYRRGVAGSARIESMHKCKNVAEVKKLMNMPEKELPAGAKRTDGALHEGKWKPIVDDAGKGFKNTKTGEVVRPKK